MEPMDTIDDQDSLTSVPYSNKTSISENKGRKHSFFQVQITI